MNWEALGAIGEIVGAVAVVLTLGYLAVQIRQNTKSVRASTHHSVGRSAREAEMVFAESETVGHIFHTGAREYDTLTVDERVRFDAILRSVFAWYEDVYFQYQQSMVSRDYWEARRRSMLDQRQRPEISYWWTKNSRLYADSLFSEVSRLLQEAGTVAPQSPEVDRP